MPALRLVLALAVSFLSLAVAWPSSAVACSFGCTIPEFRIYPAERVATTGPIYTRVTSDDACDDSTGPELVVRDATGTIVEGNTTNGVWRGTAPLVDGASYTVEAHAGATVLASSTVTAVAVNDVPPEPPILMIVEEISRGCGWSCCAASGTQGQYSRSPPSERGDTFFDSCLLEADCSQTCGHFCGTTRLAIMPQAELRWTRGRTVYDAYTFYEVYKGSEPVGRPVAELAPWESFASFGSVDPVQFAGGRDVVVSYAGFLPGEPLCLTVVPVSALEDSPGAPITVCVDDADVIRLEPGVPDLSPMESTCDEQTITSEFDLTSMTDVLGQPSIIGAWCGEVVARPFESSGASDPDEGCTVSTGPVRSPAPLCWLAWVMLGAALAWRRRPR